MTENIRRLGALLTLRLALLILPLTYWQVVRAPSLVARADNPRHAEAARRILWGRILDRSNQPLAWTEVGETGPSERVYDYPALAPVIGFRSHRHGTGGIEAAYDRQLSAETGQTGDRHFGSAGQLLDDILGRRPVGADVILTIDLALQKAADEALGERRGAIVLLDPQDGEIPGPGQPSHLRSQHPGC